MDSVVCEAVARMNLQPGETHRFPVNGYEVEIRRVPEQESDFGEGVMLQPWVEFPRRPIVATVMAPIVKQRLPEPPVIPTDGELSE